MPVEAYEVRAEAALEWLKEEEGDRGIQATKKIEEAA